MKEISTMELESMMQENKEVNIIDVREIDELVTGKISGAMHIPLGELETRVHELDPDLEYIIVCRSGGRSGHATQLLESEGFQAINMLGGMLAYKGEAE